MKWNEMNCTVSNFIWIDTHGQIVEDEHLKM